VIDRNEIIRRADQDRLPAPTVERDYILSHVLSAIATSGQAERIVFKGGTALRLCYFEDYRYSADLDFSLIDGFDRPGALEAIRRYSDQAESDCLAYTLEETAAEKLRCVIQRLQCRDLYDIHELLVVRDIDPSFVWPLFERKARHRRLDPGLFPARFEERLPQYEARWTDELSVHVPDEPPQFEKLLRAVRRVLRDALRRP
jgi:predicted nucleotidyltransferase component of viral defense system